MLISILYEEQFINSYLNFDDFSIYELVINTSKKRPGSRAGNIMKDLKNRQLFKRAYEKDLTNISVSQVMSLWKKDKNKTKDLEESISAASGVSPVDIIVHSESEEALKSYRTFGSVTQAGDMPMLYLDNDQNPYPYEDRSRIGIIKDPPRKLYVFTRSEYSGTLYK